MNGNCDDKAYEITENWQALGYKQTKSKWQWDKAMKSTSLLLKLREKVNGNWDDRANEVTKLTIYHFLLMSENWFFSWNKT